MSDFFGDDFTAELKAYFLNSLVTETGKFIDLIDNQTWKNIASETAEQFTSWAVDAKTNEYICLSDWLTERAKGLHEDKDILIDHLKNLRAYAQSLLETKIDSPELAAKFTGAVFESEEISYLHCRSGFQDFALPLLNVIEITPSLPTFALPERRKGIAGLIAFRGEAIPVIDLQEYGFADLGGKSYYFIVCHVDSVLFALQVTETDDLLRMTNKDMQLGGDSKNPSFSSLSKGFFHWENRNIMVLDLEKLVA